jgi:hypothetical protein
MGCAGRWLGTPFQRSDRSFCRHNHIGVSPSRAQPRFPIHMFGVEISSHQDRQSANHNTRSGPFLSVGSKAKGNAAAVSLACSGASVTG